MTSKNLLNQLIYNKTMTRNHTLKFECLMQWLAGKKKAVRTNRGWELLSNNKLEETERL